MCHRDVWFRLLFVGTLFVTAHTSAASDWPQWRGPDRTNSSTETGLLREWPNGGPKLLWKAEGVGEGVASVSVVAGRVFTLGYRDDQEFITAIDVHQGKTLWSTQIGPAVPERGGMRWVSQRTPTVEGDRLYAVTARGKLVCLDPATGKERWRKDYVTDFEGQRGMFGFCDYPLVDGDRLICVPGGAKAAVVALDKRTGELLWQTAISEKDATGYSVTVGAEIQGVRQYVVTLQTSVLGVRASDGKLLWSEVGTGAHEHRGAPVVDGDSVFLARPWGLRKIAAAGGAFQVERAWTAEVFPIGVLGSPVRVGDRVYFSNNGSLVALSLDTGKVAARQALTDGEAKFQEFGLTYADRRFYVRDRKNLVGLVEMTLDGFSVRGTFSPPRPNANEPGGAYPVVSDGQLYLRDMDWLLCYDVQDPGKRHRGPRPPYVPTPQDVVEQMLKIAQVKKEDMIVDLGCGDGRIVVTAAKQFGCQAVGYDLDPKCIQMALDNVKKNNVEKLVRIERQDVLDVDLSRVDVVTLYLGPGLNEKLVPQLAKMKAGSRIISHDSNIPGYRPVRVVSVKSEDETGDRKLYYHTTPLEKVNDK